MAYDHAAAVKYARAYWNRIATDGYLALDMSNGANAQYRSAPLDTTFKRNSNPGNGDGKEYAIIPNEQPLPGKLLNDCAHFISCCIGRPPDGGAGGLELKSDYPTGPYGKLGAHKLFDELNDRLKVLKIIGERVDRAAADKLRPQLAAGDLIFYWLYGATMYGHVGLYLTGGTYQNRIGCHTYLRCDVSADADQDWDSVAEGKCTYTLAQIVASKSPMV